MADSLLETPLDGNIIWSSNDEWENGNDEMLKYLLNFLFVNQSKNNKVFYWYLY